jgi:sigma-B regulation protein RsbU (phosphoserine phosphatase)
MESKLFDDIRIALEQKQANLSQWRQTTPEEIKQVQLGTVEEAAVVHQLQHIEVALEEIQEGTLGVCDICHGIVDENLLQMDYTSCVCLDHYSDEQRRQLESELELSQSVQRGLLPQEVPSIPGLDIATYTRPAQIVTGDYFDFVNFKDGTPGLVIADVSGHGVSAGLFMTSLQTAFHTLAPDTISPLDVLERINRLYIHNINFTTFVTVFFGRFDPQTRTLCYANAGHPALLYRAESDQFTWLQRTGPAIGLVEDYPFRLEEVQLRSGDILILYTDGLTEAMNSQNSQFGDQALAEVIHRNKDGSAQGLIAGILGAVNTYIRGSALADDLTLMVSKVI